MPISIELLWAIALWASVWFGTVGFTMLMMFGNDKALKVAPLVASVIVVVGLLFSSGFLVLVP